MRMATVILLVAAGRVCAGADAPGLLPFDSRWHYPHYLTWRPAEGRTCAVNPPRLSWPYLPGVVSRDNAALHTFVLEIARSERFETPIVRVETPYNFYTALPVLEPGQWCWRVQYKSAGETRWSKTRRFAVGERSVKWDRTAITKAARLLASRKHPRLAPPGGDWAAWRRKLEADKLTADWLRRMKAEAAKAVKAPWWREFPKTDRRAQTKYDEVKFARMGSRLALAAFLYRLTGDRQLLAGKDLAIALARFPRGGLASPEYHGARRKWPTQLTEFLAVVYDLLYDELTPADRRTLLDSIEWRLRATYLHKLSWRGKKHMNRAGVAMFCQSHPFENFVWSLPGVLLTAGDLKVSDELTDLCLHYLTGVTAAHGPDEGWNEGLSYGGWKGLSMLHATGYTAVLLPELRIGANPYYGRLGEWYAHLFPLGIQRLAFGDYGAAPQGKRGTQLHLFRYLAWLTGDGRCTTRFNALAGELTNRPSARSWLDLLMNERFKPPMPAPEPTRRVFPEAGWVMVSTRPPSDRKAFDDAVGMLMMCRPRGGWSHSYRAENKFVWHAYGQTLSAGGGGTAYPDPYSRHSMSHNVVLIDGKGQQRDMRTPRHPFAGRLLAWREAAKCVYWAGDATHAYENAPELARWHRHVVFVDGKWFVLFDDMAMKPDAAPARFSWLYHVAPKVELEFSPDEGRFRYQMGKVHARVTFDKKADAIEMKNMPGRDGFRNPITGEDLYDVMIKRLRAKGRDLKPSQVMAHNLWLTNRKAARQWTLLTTLCAWRDGSAEPTVRYDSSRVVRITADGVTRTVSFDPGAPGDITIDLDAVRAHAVATDPK